MQHPMGAIAVSAARAAGDLISRAVDRLDLVKVEEKGVRDLVSDVDHAAQKAIIKVIRARYPDQLIVAEENTPPVIMAKAKTSDDPVWIVDPLDGTNNFVRGLPHFAISIAVMIKQRLQLGVVYDPIRQELFTAHQGQGATLNDRKIRMASTCTWSRALIGTGFPYQEGAKLERYLEQLKNIIPEVNGLRRMGSAALDLAYVASGRLDGFWEHQLKPWDLAAGALLVREAGGWVANGEGEALDVMSGDGGVVAANPKIFKKLIHALTGSEKTGGYEDA